MIPASYYLTLSAVMFCIGVIGVSLRRNAIIVFMCIELMLNAVNISFVTFSKTTGTIDGQIAVFFVMVVAAAEAAVGLAIIISLFRDMESVDTSDSSRMRL